MKKNILLVISILLLLLSAGTFGYLYYQNGELEKEINSSNDNLKKVNDTVKKDQEEITEKEDEYEKLKDKVKENLEELSIWEEIKENLNKSLS